MGSQEEDVPHSSSQNKLGVHVVIIREGRFKKRLSVTGKMVQNHHGAATVSGEGSCRRATAMRRET